MDEMGRFVELINSKKQYLGFFLYFYSFIWFFRLSIVISNWVLQNVTADFTLVRYKNTPPALSRTLPELAGRVG
ncbi:hypothetical protein NIES2100_12980 [Calothrix sp. NIES-2100]|nr:hypothetical protein NIES2100_12980 [Calothrix sp. NIES-2100]